MDRHRSDGADGEYGGPQPGTPRHYTSDGADGGNGGPPLGGKQFFSYADLEERYGKSRVTLWRWVRKGLLPAPYAVGPNSAGFRVDEIQERDANLQRKSYGPEAAA